MLSIKYQDYNKTEDPSVPYAGKGYITKRKVSLIYDNVLKPLRNPKEPKGTIRNAKELYRKSKGTLRNAKEC